MPIGSKTKSGQPRAVLLAFYLLKPLIPRGVQLVLRRWRCRGIRAAAGGVWPIDPKAAAKPPGWAGWPGGRKFAVVLTHDVEGRRGIPRIRDVVELEKSLGFRSSFNFVGADYTVPPELRRSLKSEGFEIGVHGLHHNGLMYLSRRVFLRHARGINARLKDWGAVGFRSPAMHRNLEWIHGLDIRYDSSTFDTDPFEPFPDGVGTIFPFRVTDGSGSHSFIELPYTLAQDFTLFGILREKNIDLWKRKADWIAAKGGMLLLNTHPDYMAPDGCAPGNEEYPIRRYAELLRYLRERYEGRYWHALPAEVAEHFERACPGNLEGSKAPGISRKLRVCMPTYSYYESDNRVRRYAESLARRGHHVDVFSLNNGNEPGSEVLNGVHVRRIQRRTRNEKGAFQYLFKMLGFLVRSGFAVSAAHLKHRYQLIHVHNIPDFEVFAAALPRLTGARLILDIHDLVPELFEDKFRKTNGAVSVRAMRLVERLSTRFAHHVIVSNDLWPERLQARGLPARKISVFLNYPDPELFQKHAPQASSAEKIVVYPGTLNHHQGLDLAVAAFPKVVSEIPEARLDIYGDGPDRAALLSQVAALNLTGIVRLHTPIPLDEVAKVMAAATCGVVPKRGDGFGNEAFSTKILEFMAVGVPVVVSDTRIDRHYFSDSLVLFFESGNSADLAHKLVRILKDDALRASLVRNSGTFVAGYSWRTRETGYLKLVDALVDGRGVAAAAALADSAKS